jgi:hypothetical protein
VKHRGMRIIRYFAIVIVFATAGKAYPVEFTLGSAGGLMQQPSSEYYHFVQGAFVQLITSQSNHGVRLSYWERPVFRSNSFQDQEFGAVAVAQFAVRRGKNWRGNLGIGAGRVQGYISALDERGVRTTSSRFHIDGLASELSLQWKLGRLHFGIDHGMMIGLGPKIETEAYVAWPYQTIFINIGISI